MSLLAPWHAFVGFLEWVLGNIADVTHSGGLAIVIFTCIVKTVLLPLSLKSIRSMKAMQDIQPKIKELQKKHGKNREELQRATMALYAQHQVNPVAGCLPMLIQIPIFFGVYHAIINLSGNNATGYFTNSFLWLPDLGEPDPLFILPIAAGVFQFVQMRMSRPANAPAATDPQQQIMNTVMNIMPIFVVVFGWTFASGAVLYWATQSIYSAVQQWFVSGWGMLKNWAPWLPELPEHRRLGYVAPRDVSDVVVEYGPNGMPRSKGLMGRMQKRLEDMQEQQDARKEQLADARGSSATPARATTGKTGGTNRPANGKRTGAKAAAKTTSAEETAPGPAARSPRKRSGANRPTANRAVANVTTTDSEPVDAQFTEATATEVEETTPTPASRSGKVTSSYADRVGSATRRGPKSSWGQPGATPAGADAGED